MITKVYRTNGIIIGWEEDDEYFTVSRNVQGLPAEVQAKRGRWETQRATFNYDSESRFVGLTGNLRTSFLPVLLDRAYSGQYVWKDLLAPVGGATIPPSSAPSAANFGVVHTPQRREFSFGVGDYVFMQPFHINHDIVPNSEAFLHVHWSTAATSTGLVRWELTTMRAKGHNQANFATPTVFFVEEAAAGTPRRHMISESVIPITLTEPDELISTTLRRVAPTSGSNPDAVFGLMVDIHYQSDRDGTPYKAPNFYYVDV